MAELGGVRARVAGARRAIFLLHEGDAPAVGRAARCTTRCRARVRTRDGRAAEGTSRAIRRPVRDHADHVPARAIAQPVHERGDRRVRSAPAAPRVRPNRANDTWRFQSMRLTIFSTPARTMPIRIAFLLAAVAFSRRAGAQATS